ncbi:MAG: outer membrane beta-barrel protein [Bacteroidota bacterium]|nr:porin family protein [Bacteroidota bacterium]
MKHFYIISVSFFCFISTVFSQNNKLGIDINYPVPIGDNFIAEYYNGIFGFGIKYNFLEISNYDVGLSGNIEYFEASIFDNDITLLVFRPRISTEISLGKFIPYIGMGYSFFNYSIDTDSEIDKTKDGLNINFGLKYNLSYKIYFNLSYDYIHLRHEGIIINSSYNLDINILNIGLGIQL